MTSTSNTVSRSEFYSLQIAMFLFLAMAPAAATSDNAWFREGFEMLMMVGVLWSVWKAWMTKRGATKSAA
jgi:hypothetical protein